jgi:protein-tyrosine phosphatase
MVTVLIGVQDSFLMRALDIVREQWGGVDGYFEAAGVDEAQRGALRSLLVAD